MAISHWPKARLAVTATPCDLEATELCLTPATSGASFLAHHARQLAHTNEKTETESSCASRTADHGCSVQTRAGDRRASARRAPRPTKLFDCACTTSRARR